MNILLPVVEAIAVALQSEFKVRTECTVGVAESHYLLRLQLQVIILVRLKLLPGAA
jgi:hypothetical protein